MLSSISRKQAVNDESFPIIILPPLPSEASFILPISLNFGKLSLKILIKDT
ncbi:hypothetical protein SMU50_03031 [Streptococcus mutans 5SM3]|nr:hypothetical protein SMU50_03031 [Streptococcus mutans 5SM3]EMB87575.1 hypothetical protein SMU56_05026 [Streptococcus mutans N29]EMB89606.1 hypothetical protein SMU57_04460 [Streptococcus mutans NMT4863]